MSDPVVVFDRAASNAVALAAQVHDDQRSAPTPCTEWDVEALLGHMFVVAAQLAARDERAVAEMRFGIDKGRAVPVGDLLPTDRVRRLVWQRVAFRRHRRRRSWWSLDFTRGISVHPRSSRARLSNRPRRGPGMFPHVSSWCRVRGAHPAVWAGLCFGLYSSSAGGVSGLRVATSWISSSYRAIRESISTSPLMAASAANHSHK